MKVFVVVAGFVVALGVWDSAYNHHRLRTAVESLARDVRHALPSY